MVLISLKSKEHMYVKNVKLIPLLCDCNKERFSIETFTDAHSFLTNGLTKMRQMHQFCSTLNCENSFSMDIQNWIIML